MTKKLILYILLSVVIALPLVSPFFQKGYFETHDGEWAVVRLTEMHREIKDGQFPPQWSSYLNHGYGYPLFLFTYPFPYYIGEFLHLSGYSFVDSVKMLFVLSVVLSSLFMFLFAREMVGDLGGLITAIFYVYVPFRVVNLYVRGSIGESLSLVFFPLLCYLSLKFLLTGRKLYLTLSIPVLAAFILTHNIMAVLFVPLWLIWLIFLSRSFYEKLWVFAFRYIIPVFVLGLGLSAFFWLPALVEKKFIILSTVALADKAEHFLSIPDFFNSAWRYGLLPSFQLGWAHLLLFIIGLMIVNLSGKVNKEKYEVLSNYFTLVFFFLIFLMLPFSYIIWNLPPLSSIDFPWRLITLAIFFMASGIMFVTVKKYGLILSIVLVFVTIFGILYIAKPGSVINKGDDYYATNDATTTSMDELMPVWVKNKPTNRPDKLVELDGQGFVMGTPVQKSNSLAFTLLSGERSMIRLNMIYFPGWKVAVDGKDTEIVYDNPGGLISFIVPQGEHKITVLFTSTPIRKISYVISIGALLSFLLLSAKYLFLRQV